MRFSPVNVDLSFDPGPQVRTEKGGRRGMFSLPTEEVAFSEKALLPLQPPEPLRNTSSLKGFYSLTGEAQELQPPESWFWVPAVR